MIKEHDALVLKIEDVYNRLVTQEIYLEKYLPYNSYVQLSELLHVALDLKQIAKFEDYENAKLQNYLADILQDMGRRSTSIKGDRLSVSLPPDDKPKPHDCECGLKDFKNIL